MGKKNSGAASDAGAEQQFDDGKVALRYVGPKAWTIDNIAGSRTIWNGAGDVQRVTPQVAKRLLVFADQWAIDDGTQPSPETIEATLAAVRDEKGDVTITPKHHEEMTKMELVEFASKEYGLELSVDSDKESLLAAIELHIENQRLTEQNERNNAQIAADVAAEEGAGGNV